jgi:PAS domain S-box-containing protein
MARARTTVESADRPGLPTGEAEGGASAVISGELDTTETRIRLITERISDVIVRADMKGRILYVSPSCRILGYEPEELMGEDGGLHIHPEDVGRFLENGRILIQEGRVAAPRDRQHRFRRKDGSYVWLEGNPTVLTDAEGRGVELINVFRDVTERRLDEERLAAKEAELQLIMDRAPDMLLRITPDEKILYASPACARFGYEPAQMVGRPRSDFVHPEDYAWLRSMVLQFASEPDAALRDLCYRFRRADGAYAWVESCPTYVRDEAGKTIELVTSVRDITARREIESALAESEARYRLLADSMTDIILKFGANGIISYISPACRLIGLDPDETVGRSVLELIAPADARRAGEMIAALFSGEDVDNSEDRLHCVRTPDGREVWLEGSPTVIRDGAGAVVEVISTMRDVTKRRQTELALAESEKRFRRLAENARDIISRCDLNGRVTYISPAFELLTGFAPEELVGELADANVPEEDRPALRAAFMAALHGARDADSQRVQFRSRCKDGRVIWLESQPLPDVDALTGKVIGVTDIVRDITHRVALEDELRRARAEAEAAAAAKADLLATMSHELRTPLTSVIGFSRLVAEQPELTATTRGYVNRMGEASRALLSAVNDILDFSKLEAGGVVLQSEPTLIADLARGSLEMFQPQAGAKDIALELDCDIDDGLAITIDGDRTRQVLLNLIGNAVKFTDEGEVTLRIRYRAADRMLEVQVSDTGPGIPADRLDRLFKRYSDVDGALTRTHGGTGLGLAICKGIVEAQGGQIGAFNRPGGGSCFHFSIPASGAEQGETTARAAHALPLTGVRVLVVDDHPANRELAGLFLGGVGAELTYAKDGEEGVKAAMAQPFDAILMDLRMPKLDGPGALRKLRSQAGPNDATPILAFTAESGDPEIAAHLEAAGFQGLVGKPLTASDLIGAIASVVS